MPEPVWLVEAAVEAMHLRQLSEHGGASGVRDAGLLASTLARPKQLFAYGGARVSICALAAAYGFGIARNHPFVDGNKRTALVATLTFLQLNGLEIDAPLQSRYETFMTLAEGLLDEVAFAAWLENNARPAK